MFNAYDMTLDGQMMSVGSIIEPKDLIVNYWSNQMKMNLIHLRGYDSNIVSRDQNDVREYVQHDGEYGNMGLAMQTKNASSSDRMPSISEAYQSSDSYVRRS